ncbi:hypothetical protein SKAU_G00194300 [Synaphobranchus kaupii]|uniref:Uncharacterized protein n=1 Tax=Synaphobranchus kaupii TaxID=118154 RepID=A0A9Q1IX68_SYNKA|nr:hypothetical protein SKAU_G00194300 [Synaphobranchus kaupii]
MAAIANSESKILARIDSSTADLNAKIDSIRDDMAKQETRLRDLEDGLNTYSDKTASAEDIGRLKSEISTLRLKIDDLEGRQRRCNARTVGIKEGLETSGDQRPTVTIAKMLQELLGLNFTPTLDRAPPQPAARTQRRRTPQNCRVAKKRAAFSEAKQLLRSCQGVKFGIQFPAVLRITSPSGQDKRFEDPSAAMDYIKKNLKALVQ